jgi:hypothetical protein
MATNKVVLRTVEEFMEGYTPRYQPLYPLLMANSQAYSEEVGKVNFNRLEAVGDIRAKHITPKDTEIKQIGVKNSSKTFKKYFLANQYVQSALQSREDIEGIVAQVLDEHQKQMDEMILLGEGTAGNNVLNNGLYWSGDSNYTLESSDEIANAPDTQNEMYDLMMSNFADARELPGRKALIVYGSTALGKLDSLLPEQSVSLRQLVESAIGSDGSIVRLPSAVTPASANGWIIVNLDQVKLHYTVLPQLKAQGVNEERMYSWHNFLMGSAMLEVLSPNAVIRQPVTFEA